MPFRFRSAAVLVVLLCLTSTPALAHHEAIFGPQSSLVLSADRFISGQVFTRSLNSTPNPTEETTALVSGGVRLSKRIPITFTAIVPFSWITQSHQPTQTGFEDAILGIRYKHDLSGLQDRWDRDGNFVLGMGAVELNNGRIDHASWSGPLDSMAAMMGSIERGKWSGIGYVFGRFNTEDSTQSKKGNNLFIGAGTAYTPHEDKDTGRLVSYQLGWSFEHYRQDREDGEVVVHSGGNEMLLHPTFVFSPGHGWLFFGVVSVPVMTDMRSSAQQDRFRVGAGTVYAW